MPHDTLLTKFRKLRLNDESILQKLLAKTVEVANELGIIKPKTIIVDSTHTRSVYNLKTPIEIITEETKNLRKFVSKQILITKTKCLLNILVGI